MKFSRHDPVRLSGSHIALTTLMHTSQRLDYMAKHAERNAENRTSPTFEPDKLVHQKTPAF